MSDKFKIPSIPTSTNKSIRFPNALIDEVEKAITGTDLNFSVFVIEATKFALKNLDLEDLEKHKEEEKKKDK